MSVHPDDHLRRVQLLLERGGKRTFSAEDIAALEFVLESRLELYEALVALRQWHKEEYQSNRLIDARADVALEKAAGRLQ